MNQRTKKLEAIFEAALALESDAEREDYLGRACSDMELRREVESLLEAHRNPDSLFAEEASDSEGTLPGQPFQESVGTVIGRYKLLEKIGEGGCGVVYMAEQEEPIRRRVAFKVIKLGMDTKQVIARFEAERQALALMDHPNIAKVLDAGATDTGRPYFVMELVRGIKITDYCDQNNLSTEARLNLFVQICHAIQHAHQKGIIHRDIKPSNILVTLHDGVPVPKVIDFGIAKATGQRLTDKTLFTAFQQFIGTPAYMSPEQAEMSGLDVDTRSDIYALGVLLYELLTGSTPFDTKELTQSGVDEMRKIIREREPLRPSTRLRQTSPAVSPSPLATRPSPLATDLDWIVMKALEKDRTRRYETANGVADDVLRHLNNEPVAAHAPGRLYRLQKFVRRHKVSVGTAAVVAAVLVLGSIMSTWQAVRATRAEKIAREKTSVAELERQRASQAAEAARQNLYVSDMNVAKLAWDAGDLGRAQELLDRHRPVAGQPDYRGFEWRYLWGLCRHTERATLAGHAGPIRGIAISPDGKILATVGSGKAVKLWDLALRREATTLTGDLGFPTCLAFSPDGKTLAAGSEDHTVVLWDIASRTKLGVLGGHSKGITSVAFSPDGRTLVSASKDLSEKLWNVATLQEKNTLRGHSQRPTSAAFSPDGKTMATGSHDGTVKLWDAATGRETGTLDAHQMFVLSVAFSPDGRTLALASDDGTVGVWDLPTRRELPSLAGHSSGVTSVQFSPDGQTLASGSWDNTIRLWNTRTWSEKAVLRGHVEPISAVAFTPDNRTVISGSFDKTVKFWDADPPQPVSTVHAHGSFCVGEISPDGKTIVSAGGDGTIKLWDVTTLATLATLKGHTNQQGTCASFSPDGKMVASACADYTIGLWDVASRNEFATLTGHSDTVFDARFLSDGSTLVSCSADKSMKFWDLASFRQIASLDLGSAAWFLALSADGKLVAAGCDDGTATVVDASSRVKRFTLRAHDAASWAVAFSPNSKFLATGGVDGTVKLWDLETQTADVLRVRMVGTVAFSADGKTLVTGSHDKTIRFWNLATKQQVLTLHAHLSELNSMQFSKRGDLLLTGGTDGRIRLWPAPTLEDIDAAESTQVKERRLRKKAHSGHTGARPLGFGNARRTTPPLSLPLARSWASVCPGFEACRCPSGWEDVAGVW